MSVVLFSKQCYNLSIIKRKAGENMEITQEELTSLYWKNHPGEYKKLSAEKVRLEKEIKKAREYLAE